MKKLLPLVLAFFLLIICSSSKSQSVSYPYYGIWQAFDDGNANAAEVRGRLISFYWKDLELANNQWAVGAFDTAVMNRTKDASGVAGQVAVMISIFVYDGGRERRLMHLASCLVIRL